MAAQLDVVCVGNVVVDAVGVNVDKIPPEGSLALFDKVEMHLGGCANNTAVALAKACASVSPRRSAPTAWVSTALRRSAATAWTCAA
jgi:hypothetical protein